MATINFAGNTYAGEVLEDLLVYTAKGNETYEAGLVHVKPGIQKRYVLPHIQLGSIIQDNKPTPTSTEGAANDETGFNQYKLSERYLDPQDFMIYLEFNPRDFEEYWRFAQPGSYDPEYAYEFKETEYVEFGGKVWIPTMLPTADTLKEGYNFRYHDPRNPNIKKHMVKIALYELHKLISPNNVSTARITDYEATMQWLHDANRCKINPQIQRKLDDEKKPVSEIAMATFQRDYDPYKNPWQI